MFKSCSFVKSLVLLTSLLTCVLAYIPYDPSIDGLPGDPNIGDADNLDDERGQPPSTIAHAVLLSVAFVLIFPSGYMALRIYEKVPIHMGIQSAGLLTVAAGTILGIIISVKQDISPRLTDPHQIIGLIVFGLIIVAWVLGLIGHQIYKKRGIPPIFTRIHRVIGPLAMLLGLVNVGLGLNFAGSTWGLVRFYLSALILVLGLTSFGIAIRRKKMRKAAMITPAAQNFNAGYYNQGPPPPNFSPQPEYYGPPAGSVPMNTFNASSQGR